MALAVVVTLVAGLYPWNAPQHGKAASRVEGFAGGASLMAKKRQFHVVQRLKTHRLAEAERRQLLARGTGAGNVREAWPAREVRELRALSEVRAMAGPLSVHQRLYGLQLRRQPGPRGWKSLLEGGGAYRETRGTAGKHGRDAFAAINGAGHDHGFVHRIADRLDQGRHVAPETVGQQVQAMNALQPRDAARAGHDVLGRP